MAAGEDVVSTEGTMSPNVARALGPFVAGSADLIAIASSDWALSYINAAGRTMLGIETDGAADPILVTDLFPAEDLAYAREVVMAEFARGGRWKGTFRLFDRTAGTTLPVRLELYALRDESGAESIAIVARDISESRRADHRLRFLVDAGAALSQSLDRVETFDRLTELIVSSFATYCAIDVMTTNDAGVRTIERVAAAHVDRPGSDFLRDLNSFLPSINRSEHPPTRAILTGSSSLVSEIDDSWIDRVVFSPSHAEFVYALGLRSLITVPLVAGGDIVGALSCAIARETRHRPMIKRSYDAEDLFFLEELGRRAGTALFNARSYERERRIADSLQAASLPRSLPKLPGVRIDADYRPGSAEATIGGDWYDAFVLGDGRIAISVGDVVGHGLLAAITMTKLRQAMQAAAMVDACPRTMLRVANDTIRVHDPDAHATALAGILDIERRTFEFACAGHPGPLLRKGDGSIEEIACRGIPLGFTEDVRYEKTTLEVPGRATFVAFTDGLVEATRDILAGYDMLRGALNDPRILTAVSPAKAIAEFVLAGIDARDDVAILTIDIDAATSTTAPA
jgi:PAS domain S-box-containing protein